MRSGRSTRRARTSPLRSGKAGATRHNSIVRLAVFLMRRRRPPARHAHWFDKKDSLWPKASGELALPLSNALTPSQNPRKKLACNGALGHLVATNNDLQNAGQGTLITSSIFTGRNGGAFFILQENLHLAAVVFSVRLLARHAWLNHSDQFLQPSQPLTEAFKSDCLV